MSDYENIKEILRQKFPEESLKTLSRGGRSFTYIEGWQVIQSANNIFGEDGWSSEVLDSYHFEHLDDIICQARVKVTAMGVSKVDLGVSIAQGRRDGTGVASETLDMAMKGAVTDALKRAFRQYGDAFGNFLYEKDTPEVLDTPVRQLARQVGTPIKDIPRCPEHGDSMPSKFDDSYYCPEYRSGCKWKWYPPKEAESYAETVS